MKFIQEWGERNGRPMGADERPTETTDPLKTCLQRIAYLGEGFSFSAESRATDGVKVCVYEKPDNWQTREVAGEKVEPTPLATVIYDKHGLRTVQPAQLIF